MGVPAFPRLAEPETPTKRERVEPVDEQAASGAGPAPAGAGGPWRSRISVVSSVERYRRLARTLPGPGEAVLEIGCSTGEATRLLAATAARVPRG